MTDADKNAPLPAPNPEEAFGKRLDAATKGLLDFRGRYSRKKFWLGALGLLGLLILMLIAFAPMMSSRGGGGSGGFAVIAMLSIPLFWFYAKLIVHRLHDLGWSGWWFLLLGPLLIPLPFWMWHESHDIYHRIEQTGAAQQAIKSYVLFMEFGAYALFFGGFILMGCPRGTVGPNKYGPDPESPPSAPGSA